MSRMDNVDKDLKDRVVILEQEIKSLKYRISQLEDKNKSLGLDNKPIYPGTI